MDDILVHDVPLNLEQAEKHLVTVALGISKTKAEASRRLGVTRHILLRRTTKFGWSTFKVKDMLSTHTALVEIPKTTGDKFNWVPLGTIPFTGAANDG